MKDYKVFINFLLTEKNRFINETNQKAVNIISDHIRNVLYDLDFNILYIIPDINGNSIRTSCNEVFFATFVDCYLKDKITFLNNVEYKNKFQNVPIDNETIIKILKDVDSIMEPIFGKDYVMVIYKDNCDILVHIDPYYKLKY